MTDQNNGDATGEPTQPIPTVSADLIANALFGSGPVPDENLFVCDKRGARSGRAFKISGILDLRHLQFDRAVEFTGCIFEQGIRAEGAHFASLSLNASVLLGEMTARSMIIDGNLDLVLVRSYHQIDIQGSTIGGDLNCSGIIIEPQVGKWRAGLDCGRVTIGGSAFVATLKGEDKSHVASISGGALFTGTVIGWDFVATGAQFSSGKLGPSDRALDLSGANIGNDVLICKLPYSARFHSIGTVSLRNAKVGGDVRADGALMNKGEGSIALLMDGLTAGTVRFQRSEDIDCTTFEADGVVRLVRARIECQLICEQAQFRGDLLSLHCFGISVGGEVMLQKQTYFAGELNLDSSRLGALYDEPGSWPSRGNLSVDGCIYDTFAGQGRQFGAAESSVPVVASARLKWLKLQPQERWTSKFRPQPFVQLAKVLREMGYDDDARAVLTEMSDLRWRHWPMDGGWLGNLTGWGARRLRPFFGVTAGYGYRPLRAVACLFALWFVGVIVADWAYERGLIAPVPDRWAQAQSGRANGDSLRPYATFNACAYSFDLTVPIVSLHMQEFWTPAYAPIPWQPEDGKAVPTADKCVIEQLVVDPLSRLAALIGLSGSGVESVEQPPAWHIWFVRATYYGQIVIGWILVSFAVLGFTGLFQRRTQ